MQIYTALTTTIYSSSSRRLDYAGLNVTFLEEPDICLTGSNDGSLATVHGSTSRRTLDISHPPTHFLQRPALSSAPFPLQARERSHDIAGVPINVERSKADLINDNTNPA